jgi:choline-glycine betaine transporter
MAAIAAVLLVAGGGGPTALNGLTNGAILAATPFGILMLPMAYGLYKTLKADADTDERREKEEALAGRPPAPAAPQQMAAEDPMARRDSQDRGQQHRA